MEVNYHQREPVPIVVQRGSDILTVVEAVDNAKLTSREIAKIASQQLDFPNYIPDNASSTLIFHTESGEFLLGGTRNNPALKDQFTKTGASFPLQINATIGGYCPNADISFRTAAINCIKNKMFLNSDLSGAGLEAQRVLRELCDTIENNEGWEEKVCVHTDKWLEGETEKTMCVLTAVKHIRCSDSDILKLDVALKTIMNIKKESGEPIRTLSEFKFTELQPIITNSIDTHLEDEMTKANNAYDKFGNKISVTFNDLAIATLAKNGVFKKQISAKLTLSN